MLRGPAIISEGVRTFEMNEGVFQNKNRIAQRRVLFGDTQL
jgi:hypothetical protein